MKFVLFHQSFTSRWDHGNIRFLRSIARTLDRRGHHVAMYQPGNGPIDRSVAYGLRIDTFDHHLLDLDQALDGADAVIVHECNSRELIRYLGRRRSMGGNFQLIFYDTHHRAITMPNEFDHFDLDAFDAILAGAEILREAYVTRGWGRRVVTWHEAADARHFTPRPQATPDTDVVWIGNWDDHGCDRDFDNLVIGPVATLGLRARLYGVRCPGNSHARLHRHGIVFDGWIPDEQAPLALARGRAVIDVPHPVFRPSLPGAPTSRMFEALACGVPLLSAGWDDSEGLFHAGSYLTVADSDECAVALMLLMQDRDLAAGMAGIGLCSILARHTCDHRVAELMGFIESLAPGRTQRHPSLAREHPLTIAS